MSLSKNFDQVCLISVKEDVVRLCRKKFSSRTTVHVYSALSCFELRPQNLLIIDTDSISVEELNVRSLLNHPDSRTVFLISSSLREYDKYLILSRFTNFFDFPYKDFFDDQPFQDFPIKNNFLLPDKHSIPSHINGFFCGNSELIINTRAKILDVSTNDKPVLLFGETGTGKSTAAKLIYEISARRKGPFKSFNTVTVPDNLAESILFGSKRGGYTDAINLNGLFILADNGVVFLDEFEMASMLFQTKLLTFLDDGIINYAGTAIQKKVSVRLICAINTEIKHIMDDEHFRNDLYQRFCRNIVRLPSLRERPEDIPFIVRKYLSDNNVKKFFSNDALEKLMDYSWFGNMRELTACLEETVRICPNEKITADYISFGDYLEKNKIY